MGEPPWLALVSLLALRLLFLGLELGRRLSSSPSDPPRPGVLVTDTLRSLWPEAAVLLIASATPPWFGMGTRRPQGRDPQRDRRFRHRRDRTARRRGRLEGRHAGAGHISTAGPGEPSMGGGNDGVSRFARSLCPDLRECGDREPEGRWLLQRHGSSRLPVVG